LSLLEYGDSITFVKPMTDCRAERARLTRSGSEGVSTRNGIPQNRALPDII
jgi:hypothetical protein